MPIVACPEVFGGSPGLEKDCGWYCEFALGSETWAYVVQFIAVALLASVQAMKQRKFPAPIVIVFVEIGLYVVWFFSRPGGAVDQPSGRMLSNHRSAADAGNGSEFYFDLPATSKGLRA
jgi:hypothetical protein